MLQFAALTALHPSCSILSCQTFLFEQRCHNTTGLDCDPTVSRLFLVISTDFAKCSLKSKFREPKQVLISYNQYIYLYSKKEQSLCM